MIRFTVILCLLFTSTFALAESSRPEAEIVTSDVVPSIPVSKDEFFTDLTLDEFQSLEIDLEWDEPESNDFSESPLSSRQRRDEAASVSTVAPSYETKIDLRPPSFSIETGTIELKEHWLNNSIDDHLLFYRDVQDDISILPRGSSDFGITSLGFRLFSVNEDEGPWWLTTFFGWNFLSGPTSPDVRAQTYDLGVEFNYVKQMSENVRFHFRTSPIFASDFHNTSKDSLRITAGGLLSFQTDDHANWVAGFTYLDRDDLPILPILGVRLKVSQTFEVDLIVPSPKISLQYSSTEKGKSWIYTAGEVGGGSWAIERGYGINDQFGYRDLRWTIGSETRYIDGSRRFFEAGYIFDRKLSYQSGIGNDKLESSFLFRFGSQF